MNFSMVERLTLMNLIPGHRTDGITGYYLKAFTDAITFTDEEMEAWKSPCEQSTRCKSRQDLCPHRDAEIKCSKRQTECVCDMFTAMNAQKQLTSALVTLVQKFAPKLLPESVDTE